MKSHRRKRGSGRPLTHSLELPLYDSMHHMAAATKIPLAALKHAKNNGCLFIRHGRCELAVFLAWFFNKASGDEGDIDWAKRDKRAAAMIKEIELEKLREQLIDFSCADRFVRKLVSNFFFGELDRLAHEFPAVLKAKDELRIHEEVLRQIEIVKSNLRGQLTEWEGSKGAA